MAFDGELNPIKDSRFDKFEYVASGAWGSVYKAFDTRLKKEIAIKVLNPSSIAEDQMQQRKINLEEAMIKDADLITNSDHIVPRQLFEDDDGKLFLTMPFYENFLDGYLGDTPEDAQRKSVKAKSLSLDEMLSLSIDISQGLEDLHDYGRSHGDIKPDNIALKGKRGKNSALINDLGSSTLEAYGERSENPRDNIGFMYTRAPEQFKEGAHPTSQSDIWAMGSLMYRMITGDYILENEIDDIMNDRMLSNPLLALGKFMQREEEDLESMIQKRISKNASTWVGLNPFGLSKILKKSLTLDMDERYSSMEELESDLQDLVKQRSTSEVLGSVMKKFALPSLIASIPLAFGAYHLTKPPSDLSMPSEILGEYSGYVEYFLPKQDESFRLIVEDETIESLQQKVIYSPEERVENVSEFDREISSITDNLLVAHIMKQFFVSEKEYYEAAGMGAYLTWGFGGEVDDECRERVQKKRDRLSGDTYFPRGMPLRTVSDETIDKKYPDYYCYLGPMKEYGGNPDIYLNFLEERILEGFEHAHKIESREVTAYRTGGNYYYPTKVYLEDVLAISLVGVEAVDEAKDRAREIYAENKSLEAEEYEEVLMKINVGYDSDSDFAMFLRSSLSQDIEHFRNYASTLRTDYNQKPSMFPHLGRGQEAEFYENLVRYFDDFQTDEHGGYLISGEDLESLTKRLAWKIDDFNREIAKYEPLFSDYNEVKSTEDRYVLPQHEMSIVNYWTSAVISNSS